MANTLLIPTGTMLPPEPALLLCSLATPALSIATGTQFLSFCSPSASGLPSGTEQFLACLPQACPPEPISSNYLACLPQGCPPEPIVVSQLHNQQVRLQPDSLVAPPIATILLNLLHPFYPFSTTPRIECHTHRSRPPRSRQSRSHQIRGVLVTT